MVVIGLGKNLLFKSVLGHCGRNMKKKYDRGSNLHEDSVLRFDDQLAFVLKYYTPSLSLEINDPLNYYK